MMIASIHMSGGPGGTAEQELNEFSFAFARSIYPHAGDPINPLSRIRMH